MITITHAVIIRRTGERIPITHLIGSYTSNVDVLKRLLYPEIEKWHGKRIVYNEMIKEDEEMWWFDLETIEK